MNKAKRTNIYISDDCRAILSALGAATTGRPNLAAGLSELISRVTEGIVAYPSGDMSKTPYKGQYKAYWTHPGQTNAAGDPVSAEASAAIDTQVTEYAYPSRAEATTAAVLLRYEQVRAQALAQPEPEKVQP